MKKTISHIFAKLAILLSAAVLFSCQQKEPELHFLEVYNSSYTFTTLAEESFEISIEAYTDWTFEKDQDWLNVERNDDDILTITASPNEETEERYTTLTIIAGSLKSEVTINQLAPHKSYHMIMEFSDPRFSPGGKYIGGIGGVIEDDQIWAMPVVVNTQTGETTKHKRTLDDIYISAVDDKGNIFFNQAGRIVILDLEGNRSYVKFPENTSSEVAKVEAVSLDGRIWVGYGVRTNQKGYSAIKWIDGEPEILEELTETVSGSAVIQGCMARGCSDDGSMIYGSAWDEQEAIYWDKDGKIHRIAENTIEIEILEEWDNFRLPSHPAMTSEKNNMSPNGRYIAFNYRTNTIFSTTHHPMVYDLETKQSWRLPEEHCFPGIVVQTVDNDGNLFVGNMPSKVMKKTGEVYEMEEWVRQNFGYEISANHNVLEITPDGKTICGDIYQSSIAGLTRIPFYLTSKAVSTRIL